MFRERERGRESQAARACPAKRKAVGKEKEKGKAKVYTSSLAKAAGECPAVLNAVGKEKAEVFAPSQAKAVGECPAELFDVGKGKEKGKEKVLAYYLAKAAESFAPSRRRHSGRRSPASRSNPSPIDCEFSHSCSAELVKRPLEKNVEAVGTPPEDRKTAGTPPVVLLDSGLSGKPTVGHIGSVLHRPAKKVLWADHVGCALTRTTYYKPSGPRFTPKAFTALASSSTPSPVDQIRIKGPYLLATR